MPHQETCPYCNEKIEVEYGRNIPCPNCHELINVYDPKKNPSVDRGYSVRPLSDYAPARSQYHEGKAGGTVSRTGVSYDDIGGLDGIIEEVDLLVNGPVKYPAVWEKLGRKKTRAVLLTGPPGCGKTLLVQALANETGRKICIIQGSEIKGWRQGASEGNLVAAYESVRPNGILVIDEIDAIGGKREQMVNETNVSIVGTLCSILDGAKYKDSVVVIATTNKPHMLDSALRRPGRFDLEIHVPPPDLSGRERIFEIHTQDMPLSEGVDLSELAKRAHGFTGADIAGVCAKISQELLKRAVRQLREGAEPGDVARQLVVDSHEFKKLIDATIPSLLRESYVEVSTVGWDDVGGLSELKEELESAVVWPLMYGEQMRKLNLRPPRGALLYGPPGCGKTLLVRAIAGESEYNFLAVNGPALLSQWVGSTEEAIRDLFWKARQAAPCIIFLDEVESIAPVRGRTASSDVMDRAVSQFLAEIDGVQTLSDVFVIAATNRPDLVDPALLRPGRLDLQYEVPLPDEAARKEIFEIHLRGAPLLRVDTSQLADLADGLSGAKIEWVCTTAKKFALARHIESGKELAVTQGDLIEAFNRVVKREY